MTGIIVTNPPAVELPPGSNSSNPASLPPVTYTYAVLNLPQTWTALQTFPAGTISLHSADILDPGNLPVSTAQAAALALKAPASTEIGYVSISPNPHNSPGSGNANQVATDGFGNPIVISATTTGGLAEIDAVSALTGWPIKIQQWGTTSAGTNPQFIGISTTWTLQPRGIHAIDIDASTINCVMTNGTPGVVFDSMENGRFNMYGQIVSGTNAPTVIIKPVNQTPQDHLVVYSLNEWRATTLVTNSVTTPALLKIDLSTTPSLGVQQNTFKVMEMNGGGNPIGLQVTNPASVSGGQTPIFNHNSFYFPDIHGNTTAGIQVGTSTTNQSQMSGNIYTALFTDNTATDGVVTYERNSLFTVGFHNNGSALTNGIHFKSGALNNTVLLLDTAGATNPVVDDNGVGSTNIIIGNGNIITPAVYGGSAAASVLTLAGSSNASPSGDYVAIGPAGSVMYIGKVVGGAAGFVGFAVNNTGQADGTHYGYMSDGFNSYFNAPNGVISFRMANSEVMQLHTSGGLGVGTATDPGVGALLTTASIKSNGATAGIGYATGAGGTVTQATSKSTGVTLSKVSGQITMNAAALAAGTIVSFVLTNTAIAATDVLVMNHISGGTVGSYLLNAQCAAGSATINVRNETAGSLSEAVVIQFVLIKGVTA